MQLQIFTYANLWPMWTSRHTCGSSWTNRIHGQTCTPAHLAVELWGSPSAALRQRVRPGPTGPWREVIGVVEDVRENGVHRVAPAIVYWPSRWESAFQAGQADVPRSVAFAVRSSQAGTEGLLNAIRQAVWSVNPNLPLSLVRTMQSVYDESMAQTTFALTMLALAASLALMLGIVGIYGVISYGVAQRTREIGVRLALGAQRTALRRMFLRDGLLLASLGVTIGLAAAAALTRVMTSLLFEVSPLDPLTPPCPPCCSRRRSLPATCLRAGRQASTRCVR